MKTFEMRGKSSNEKKLIQLESLLNIEIPVSGTLILLWWLLPGEIIFLIFSAAAILIPVFIIVLALLLFQLRKFGWFSALILFVILPLCVIPFYSDGSPTYPFYYVLPLGFFGFYSLFLRVVVPTWDD
ncbi:MAG: hypothetical protein GVY20_05405 [Bacteroidetes bacterium]|jgi:hypothetical protein|nr:hypothetical protein [Bacteroidota bacterium]